MAPEGLTIIQHAELLLLCNGVADEVNWQGEFRGTAIDLRKDLA